MPAPSPPPEPCEPDATRWGAPADEALEPTRAGGSPGTTRWDLPPGPVAPSAAGALDAADSTRWDGAAGASAQAGERPSATLDPDKTRWEGTGTKRVSPVPLADDLGRTRWDQRTAAPGGEQPRTTLRFDDVLSPSAPTAADLTPMTLGDARVAPASPSQPAPPPGARRYELLAELGRGGMGVVHRAREVATGREVALKVALVDLKSARDRFVREGQVTAALNHPNILRVHGAGELDGRPYLAYELIEGCRSLADAFRDPSVDLAGRVRYVRDAARALGYAHAQGVVHRDVKPQNLLIDLQGRLKVADFGLAAGVDLERLTLSGAQLGTPSYMAPEQVDARREDLGPWTDVWALGVILYEALARARPFVGDGFPQLCAAIATRSPAAPRARDPGVPEALDAICMKALSKRPNERYLDGEAMALDLDRALAGEVPLATRARLALRRARRGLMALLGVALTGLALAGALEVRDRLAAQERVGEARAALAAARRTKGTSLADLLAAAAAHRAAEAALARLPEADALAVRAGEPEAAERRREVLALLVPALLAGGRGAEAVEHGRDLDRLAPSTQARGWLLRALITEAPLRAEAHRLALELGRAGAEADALRVAAEALVALQRPADAVTVLAGATRVDLALLRASARLLAGDQPAEAVADARAAAGGDAVERAAVLARALVAAGQHDEALAALEEARREGGRRWEWHAARGVALAARDRPGEARASFADALAIASQAVGQPGAAAAVRADRGRLHLTRGRCVEALADLEHAVGPDASLDAAIARWCGGEADEGVVERLDALIAAAATFGATPRVAAAAQRWRAWIALAGRDAAGALQLLGPGDTTSERLWLDVEATRRVLGAAAALARLDGPGSGLVAPSEDLRALRARLLLELGRAEDAAAVAASLPRGSPARADVERGQLAVGAPAADLAAADLRALVARAADPQARARALPVPSRARTSSGTLVAALARQGLLLVPASARDEGARARCVRLLARVVALDPDHALAHASLARVAQDVPLADRAVERWPWSIPVRRAALMTRVELDAPQADWLASATALLGDPVDEIEPAGVVAAILATRGDLAGAWRVLEPRIDAPHVAPQLLDLAAKVARDRGDLAGSARVQARVERMILALRGREGIRGAAWDSGNLTEYDRRLADIPLDHVLFKDRIDLALHVSEQVGALLTFGRLLTVPAHPTDTPPLLGIAHSHGFNALGRAPVVVGGLEAHIASEPLDPAGYLARAGYASSCHFQVRPDNAEYGERVELCDRAADWALEGAALTPRRAGPLLLAAFCTMNAGDLAEAAALLTLGELALGERSDLVWFLSARLAALRGDAPAAERALHAMERDPQNRKSIYELRDDPAFAKHLAEGRMALPPAWR